MLRQNFIENAMNTFQSVKTEMTKVHSSIDEILTKFDLHRTSYIFSNETTYDVSDQVLVSTALKIPQILTSSEMVRCIISFYNNIAKTCGK